MCYSENDNDISDTVEVSEVIPSRDLNFFKRGSRLIPENDMRFHYEDNILEAEILDSGEKLDPRIAHDFIDSDDSSEDANEREKYEKLILSDQNNKMDENLSYHFESK